MLARLSVRVFADPEELDLHDLIVRRLRTHAYGRRWLYQYFVSSVNKGNPRPPVYLRRILASEDLPWLLGQAQSRWKGILEVWADLYLWATNSSEQGAADEVLLERALGAIARHAPSIPEDFEKVKREVEQQEQQIE